MRGYKGRRNRRHIPAQQQARYPGGGVSDAEMRDIAQLFGLHQKVFGPTPSTESTDWLSSLSRTFEGQTQLEVLLTGGVRVVLSEFVSQFDL